MNCFFGYILFENSVVIPQMELDLISDLECGVSQNDRTVFNTSLDGTKSLVRIKINKKGQDLIDALDLINIDTYSIFGEHDYPENEMASRLRTSETLAYSYFDTNRALYEIDPRA
jgi:hypothetical protein